jgi:hypothetical protein
MPRSNPKPAVAPRIRGANDNNAPNSAIATDAGAPLPYPCDHAGGAGDRSSP